MVNGLDEISSTFIAAGQPEALIPFGATNSTVLISAISLFVASLLGELGVSTHRHRIYTSKDAASAKKSFIITAIVALGFVLIPIISAWQLALLQPRLVLQMLCLQIET